MDEADHFVHLCGGTAEEGGRLPTFSAGNGYWGDRPGQHTVAYNFLRRQRDMWRKRRCHPEVKAMLDDAFPGWWDTGAYEPAIQKS